MVTLALVKEDDWVLTSCLTWRSEETALRWSENGRLEVSGLVLSTSFALTPQPVAQTEGRLVDGLSSIVAAAAFRSVDKATVEMPVASLRSCAS